MKIFKICVQRSNLEYKATVKEYPHLTGYGVTPYQAHKSLFRVLVNAVANDSSMKDEEWSVSWVMS